MKKYIILFLIILLGVLLRFYRLTDFPVQLNHDEITQLYDAISIAETGKDIYGNFMPFIFESVHDFKPPFYTYITSLLYLIVGGGELTIRLPGVIFGISLIPAVFIFVFKLLKNRNIALLAAFITAIAPFEIFFSRKSFENGAGIFLMLLGFSCLINFIEERYSKWLYLAVILLSAGLYTYFSHAVIIPLLLFSFVLIFKKHFLSSKNILPLVLFIAISFPLLFMIMTDSDTRYRSQTVFIGQDVNLGRLIDYGKTDDPAASSFTKNKSVFDFTFNRYLEQFNPGYIFGNGLDFTNQGPVGVGPLLFIQLPFLILGIIFLIKTNLLEQKRFIVAWILLGAIPSGLTFESHSPHRIVMVFTMLNIISAVGLYVFLKWVKRLRSRLKTVSVVFLFGVFVINFIYFIHMYFINFPFEKSQEIHYPFKQVAQFAKSEKDSVDQIIFDPLFGEVAPVIGTAAHYYLAYYGDVSPLEFQREYRYGEKEREVLFDKYSVRKINWLEDQNLKNVLLIGSVWNLPIDSIDQEKIIRTFYFYNGKPAFYAIKL